MESRKQKREDPEFRASKSPLRRQEVWGGNFQANHQRQSRQVAPTQK